MKINKHFALLAVFSSLAAWALVAQAQSAGSNKADGATAVQPAAKVDDLTLGEIRRVDKVNKGLVIKHGDIKNLKMPAMTMPFRVKQPAMLDQVKEGDKIRFRAEQIGDDLVVTEIHVSKP